MNTEPAPQQDSGTSRFPDEWAPTVAKHTGHDSIDAFRHADLQNVVYAVLHSKADLIRSINPETPGAGDQLLCKMLEWGWEHHAPPGKRYHLHNTLYFKRELDLESLSTIDPVSAIAKITEETDALIEEARAACNSKSVDSLTLHGYSSPSTVCIWIKLIVAQIPKYIPES